MFNKKGAFTTAYWEHWAEIYTLILIVIGFLISITIRNVWVIYTVIFLAGFMAGRMMYQRKTREKFAYFLIIIGFLFGYLIGAFTANRKVVIFLFVLAAIVSYYLHEKKYIK